MNPEDQTPPAESSSSLNVPTRSVSDSPPGTSDASYDRIERPAFIWDSPFVQAYEDHGNDTSLFVDDNETVSVQQSQSIHFNQYMYFIISTCNTFHKRT